MPLPASDIPSRVAAATAKETTSSRRTPNVSVSAPAKKLSSVTSSENTDAHQPAASSLSPKSPESQRGSVCRNEKMPMYSRNVAK